MGGSDFDASHVTSPRGFHISKAFWPSACLFLFGLGDTGMMGIREAEADLCNSTCGTVGKLSWLLVDAFMFCIVIPRVRIL